MNLSGLSVSSPFFVPSVFKPLTLIFRPQDLDIEYTEKCEVTEESCHRSR
jgi:hypothetical protein